MQQNEEKSILLNEFNNNDHDENSADIQNDKLSKVSFGGRVKLLCCPVQSFKKLYDDDGHIELIIAPEAFRMLFYFGLLCFLALSIVVSIYFSDELDLENNIFIDLYGGNFVCIYFDYPPFNYFATILWFPLSVTLLFYEAFDQYRSYDDYINNKIGKKFYIFYTTFTIFECFVWWVSIQTTGTSPDENHYVHTVPFLLLLSAAWTMTFKRFIYIYKIGLLNKYSFSILYKLAAWTYIILLTVCAIMMTLFLWPNLFGAKLYKRPGFEWSYHIMGKIVDAWTVLALICPMIIYFVITKDLKTITITIVNTPKRS